MGMAPPALPVPPPRGVTKTPCVLAAFKTHRTSSVDRGRTTAARIEQGHIRRNQLVQILVARDDDDLGIGTACAGRQRADDVVGLIAVDYNERNVERSE